MLSPLFTRVMRFFVVVKVKKKKRYISVQNVCIYTSAVKMSANAIRFSSLTALNILRS